MLEFEVTSVLDNPILFDICAQFSIRLALFQKFDNYEPPIIACEREDCGDCTSSRDPVSVVLDPVSCHDSCWSVSSLFLCVCVCGQMVA